MWSYERISAVVMIIAAIILLFLISELVSILPLGTLIIMTYMVGVIWLTAMACVLHNYLRMLEKIQTDETGIKLNKARRVLFVVLFVIVYGALFECIVYSYN